MYTIGCILALVYDDLNFDNLSLIPSNVNLAGAEIELIGVEDKEFILKNAIDQVRDQYDFIIIDCPPSLNMLTINAMTTADTATKFFRSVNDSSQGIFVEIRFLS